MPKTHKIIPILYYKVMPLSKKDKIKQLKASNFKKIDDLPDEVLTYVHRKLNKHVKPKKESIVVVDKTSVLYKLRLKFVLKILNIILKNIKKDPITKLTEFIDVDSNDINSEANIKMLDEIDKDIIEQFGDKCYNKRAKRTVIVLIKTFSNRLGFTMERKSQEVYNDEGYRRTACLYTITSE